MLEQLRTFGRAKHLSVTTLMVELIHFLISLGKIPSLRSAMHGRTDFHDEASAAIPSPAVKRAPRFVALFPRILGLSQLKEPPFPFSGISIEHDDEEDCLLRY